VCRSLIASEGCPLEGILPFFMDHCGGNAKEEDAVRLLRVALPGALFTERYCEFEKQAARVCEPSFASLWIRIDFGNYRINLTHDSICTRTDSDSRHARSWVIERSNDSWQNWFDRIEHSSMARGFVSPPCSPVPFCLSVLSRVWPLFPRGHWRHIAPCDWGGSSLSPRGRTSSSGCPVR
jgi:hypothetical protein